MTRYVDAGLSVIRSCAFCAGLMLLTADSTTATALAVGMIYATAMGDSGDDRRGSLIHNDEVDHR